MKIRNEANSKPWWVGREIICECGFHAEIEPHDVEVNHMNLFDVMQSFIDYRCDCERLITIHQDS
ncbi:MAG: hypothetical protein ACR2PH_11535 [Desulfobulbia bacterium]